MIEKGLEIEESLILKYKNVLPEELIEIWVNYGFANMLDGYLKVINPDEYKEILDDTYSRGEFSIPILITAFGDIITIEDEQYIGIVKYKNGVFDIISKSFKSFLQNIKDDYFLDKYFEIYKYIEIVGRIGYLESTECFGYVPLLALGGNEEINNVHKVKIKEHIELISQVGGKIG